MLFEMFKKEHRKLDIEDNTTLIIFTRENIFIQLEKQQGKCVFLRESLPPDIQFPIDLVAELCLCLLVAFFRHRNVDDKFIDNDVTTSRPTKEQKIPYTIPQTRFLKDDGFVGSVNKVTASVYKAQAERYREIAQTVAAKISDTHLTRTKQKHYEPLYKKAQSSAEMAYFSNNFSEQSEDYTLDLHHFYVREAIEALDIFLDKEISALKNKENQTNQELIIITGRGIHSREGKPKIKPKVKERLEERELDFEENESNPGRVHVLIYKDSLFTTEL